jgi:hypothetical protein
MLCSGRRFFDTFIASQDGKYTYWYTRSSQLDTSIVPLFPVLNHPSYPSNHATLSNSRTEIHAYLFPQRTDFIRAEKKKRAILASVTGWQLRDRARGVKRAASVLKPAERLVGTSLGAPPGDHSRVCQGRIHPVPGAHRPTAMGVTGAPSPVLGIADPGEDLQKVLPPRDHTLLLLASLPPLPSHWPVYTSLTPIGSRRCLRRQ